MLKFTDSLKKAQKLLSAVKKLLREKNIKTDAWVQAYSNGREQGYCIRDIGLLASQQLSISFSECRGSDQLVVYIGIGERFDQGNVPTDEAYKNAKYFRDGDYQKAAAFIVNALKKTYELWEQTI